MADPTTPPLYDDTAVAIREDATIRVDCHPAGPAGSSMLELPDGTVWEVDHVLSHVPVSIQVDARDPRDSRHLVMAFGSDGATRLADRLGRVADPDGVAPDPGRGSSTPEHDDGSHIPGSDRRTGHDPASYAVDNDEPRALFGWMVLLADLAHDPVLDPFARIAAAAEFIVTADGDPVGRSIIGAERDLIRRVQDLIGEIDDDDIDRLPADLSYRLGVLCARAADLVGRGAAVLGDLADRLGVDGDDVAAGSGRPGLRVMMLEPPDVAEEMMPDLAMEPLRLETRPDTGPDYLDVERPTPTLLRVVVAREGGERWVRVLHRDGLVLLAQAPLATQDLVQVAELVVPPDVADSDLEIRIVEFDDADEHIRRPIEVVRQAVQVGREAARYGRLGERSMADALWNRCADLWAQVGDHDRAGLARALMNPPEVGRIERVSLADRIMDAI